MLADDSRYATVPLSVEYSTGETWLRTRVPITLAPADDDIYVEWTDGDTWDALAYRAWADELGARASTFYWVICDLNGILNPLEPPPDLTKPLRIPSAARLLTEVIP